jgi:hypothetical protein
VLGLSVVPTACPSGVFRGGSVSARGLKLERGRARRSSCAFARQRRSLAQNKNELGRTAVYCNINCNPAGVAYSWPMCPGLVLSAQAICDERRERFGTAVSGSSRPCRRKRRDATEAVISDSRTDAAGSHTTGTWQSRLPPRRPCRAVPDPSDSAEHVVRCPHRPVGGYEYIPLEGAVRRGGRVQPHAPLPWPVNMYARFSSPCSLLGSFNRASRTSQQHSGDSSAFWTLIYMCTILVPNRVDGRSLDLQSILTLTQSTSWSKLVISVVDN